MCYFHSNVLDIDDYDEDDDDNNKYENQDE
jgi:hypothetical protein